MKCCEYGSSSLFSIHCGHDTHLIGRVVWISSSIYEVPKLNHQLYELAKALAD
jgi:hypothetical protein